ncbi:peptide chain release factor 1 [archaeon]|jgi:peptide chain release factor subunit 1|nr:peptide chain release factor 1 [archaeon]MBT3577470.1 peptide chain release factor 1 [archaeon]MBT6820287.1 peptide chain release factor 1 [archaeon]MBT7025101.1 peptide chain release factor 1 [archaeon]MBT7238696.1 peptide chain release factor 1 [archaeon]
MDEAQKFELESTVEELEGYRGRHTELITVLVPAGATLTQTTKQLEDEKGTATNIKSTATRKNVINSLERAIRKLKEIGRTPKNGLAVYAGNVTMADGKESLEVWAIEPPKPLKVKIYRCDQTFIVDPLKEMLETDEVYGLLIIERNEASIGILDGRSIRQLDHMTSGIPGKTRAGGQSAQRFARIRESAAKEFFKRVAENMKKHFWDNKKLKGILVGGPIPTKDEFLDQGQLVTALKNKVIAVKDIGGTGMHGLKELVLRCEDVLAEQEITKQKQILDEFFERLAKEPNKVSYGEAEIEDRLNRGAVDKLIISKTLPREKIKVLEKLAKASSTEIHLVTKETAEGVQFDNLGGVGGLLRFEIHD